MMDKELAAAIEAARVLDEKLKEAGKALDEATKAADEAVQKEYESPHSYAAHPIYFQAETRAGEAYLRALYLSQEANARVRELTDRPE